MAFCRQRLCTAVGTRALLVSWGALVRRPQGILRMLLISWSVLSVLLLDNRSDRVLDACFLVHLLWWAQPHRSLSSASYASPVAFRGRKVSLAVCQACCASTHLVTVSYKSLSTQSTFVFTMADYLLLPCLKAASPCAGHWKRPGFEMVWSSLALVALTVAGSIPGGYCQDRQMMQQYPVTSYDNLAVCNDNSTYNYYHRPGVGSGSNQ